MTALTVTATETGTGGTAPGIALTVKVLTGQAASPIGVTASSPTITVPQLAITPGNTGSWVYGAVTNLGASTAFTANAASTFSQNVSDATNTEAYGTFRSTSTTTAATPVTLGASAPSESSGFLAIALLEVLKGAGSLAEDASSPAGVNTKVAVTISTASFNPPPGSLLVAMVSCGATGTVGDPMTMTVTDSLGFMTWTKQASASVLNGSTGFMVASVWTAVVPSFASGNILESAMAPAGTVNNPFNITAGALNMSPMQVAGQVGTQKNISGNIPLYAMTPAGTVNNPLNILSGAVPLSTMSVAGGVGTQHLLSSGSVPLSVMRLEGSVLSGHETLLINGQDIMSCARAFAADLSGLLFVPLVRTGNIAVPGKQGLVSVPRKLYDRAQIPMTIWVRGMNADNTWPALSLRDEVFYENLDILMQMFAVSGTVTLSHLTPDGTTREITGQVLQAFTPKRYAWSAQSTGNLQVIIECTEPFWREPATVTDTVTAPTTTPVTGQLAGQDGSTAPIEDAVVTFAGPCTNPRLTCGDWYVQYSDAIASGHSVAIDCGAWTVTGTGFTADYSKLVHAGLGPWIIFPPAPPGSGGPSVTYAITAGGSSACTVAAQRAFLGG